MGADLAVARRRAESTRSPSTRGVVISRAGDSFVGAFEHVDDAVTAAIAAQQGLRRDDVAAPRAASTSAWGIHLGDAQRRGEGWYGLPLNEAARMMAAAHGGQIVVSESVAARASRSRGSSTSASIASATSTAPGASSRSSSPGLVHDFPPLRSMGSYVTTLPAQRTPLIGRDDLVSDDPAHAPARTPARLADRARRRREDPRSRSRHPAASSRTSRRRLLRRPHPTTDGAEVLAAIVGGVRTVGSARSTGRDHLAEHLGDQPAAPRGRQLRARDRRIAAELLDGLLTAVAELRGARDVA